MSEIDRILRSRETSKGKQYLIRWKGYSSSHDLWINDDDFIIKEFLPEETPLICEINNILKIETGRMFEVTSYPIWPYKKMIIVPEDDVSLSSIQKYNREWRDYLSEEERW